MARADGRIEPRQKLSTAISARAWNRAQDAADIVLGERARFGADSTAIEKASNIVLIRNDSGSDVPWLGVLGIASVAINPVGGTLGGIDAASDRAREFVRRPLLVGGTPSLSTYSSFVVAMEPIPIGAIGRAAVGGVFVCRVDVVATWHEFANMRTGDRSQLQSTDCGPLKLLWKEGGVGQNKWAMGVM
jgi:hypothetical protein